MIRLILILSLLMIHSIALAQQASERMAVLELKNKAEFTNEEVEYLSGLLRRLASSELAQNFIVYDKQNITELLPF